jgi:hypothetical protein
LAALSSTRAVLLGAPVEIQRRGHRDHHAGPAGPLGQQPDARVHLDDLGRDMRPAQRRDVRPALALGLVLESPTHVAQRAQRRLGRLVHGPDGQRGRGRRREHHDGPGGHHRGHRQDHNSTSTHRSSSSGH